MARRRKGCKMGIAQSIFMLVKFHCIDYDRRARFIDDPFVPEDIREKYSALNRVIDEALEKVDRGLRDTLFKDVQLSRGYDHSPISPFIAQNTYYLRKKALILDIAKGYSLI